MPLACPYRAGPGRPFGLPAPKSPIPFRPKSSPPPPKILAAGQRRRPLAEQAANAAAALSPSQPALSPSCRTCRRPNAASSSRASGTAASPWSRPPPPSSHGATGQHRHQPSHPRQSPRFACAAARRLLPPLQLVHRIHDGLGYQ